MSRYPASAISRSTLRGAVAWRPRHRANKPSRRDSRIATLAPGPKVFPSFCEVRRRVGQMVIRGRDEQQVHRLRDLESVTTYQHGPDRRDPPLVGRAEQVIEGALARVERVDDAGRFDLAGEPEGEVPITRTEIAYDDAGPEVEGRDHRVRVAQAILARSAGVQPSADRSGQPVESHAVAQSIWESGIRSRSARVTRYSTNDIFADRIDCRSRSCSPRRPPARESREAALRRSPESGLPATRRPATGRP